MAVWEIEGLCGGRQKSISISFFIDWGGNANANLRARRQDATPDVVFPVPTQLGIGFNVPSACSADESLKVHTPSRCGPIYRTVDRGCRAIFYALRIAQKLVVLLFDAIP